MKELLIENSKNFYYVQTDSDGVIEDCNNYFTSSFTHIQPFRVHDIVFDKDKYKLKRFYAKLYKMGVGRIWFTEIRTIRPELATQWTLVEAMRIKDGFIAWGIDLFPAYEEGTGLINRQNNLLRDINQIMNHSIMAHFARIEGVVRLSSDTIDEKHYRMLTQSMMDAREEIIRLVNRIDETKR